MRTKGEIDQFLSVQHRKFLKEIRRAKEANQSYVLTADDVLEMSLLAQKHDEHPILTGVPFWDELVGPFRRGNVYVLAGYAGVGKTTLAVQLCWAVAKQNRKAWMYNLELSPPEVLEVACGHIVQNAEPKQDEMVLASTKLHNSGFRFFDSRTYQPWQKHLEIIESGVEKEGFELVVIDNFHYMTRSDKNVNDIEGVVSQRLKALSQSCNIPILLIHHLRKPESDATEPEPTMHAMRGSSAILNDASGVIILHHPLAPQESGENTRYAVGRIRVEKARWNMGGTKYVRLIGHKKMYEQAVYSEYKNGNRHEARKKRYE